MGVEANDSLLLLFVVVLNKFTLHEEEEALWNKLFQGLLNTSSPFSPFLQDEKNQLLITNIWLKLVSYRIKQLHPYHHFKSSLSL